MSLEGSKPASLAMDMLVVFEGAVREGISLKRRHAPALVSNLFCPCFAASRLQDHAFGVLAEQIATVRAASGVHVADEMMADESSWCSVAEASVAAESLSRYAVPWPALGLGEVARDIFFHVQWAMSLQRPATTDAQIVALLELDLALNPRRADSWRTLARLHIQAYRTLTSGALLIPSLTDDLPLPAEHAVPFFRARRGAFHCAVHTALAVRAEELLEQSQHQPLSQ